MNTLLWKKLQGWKQTIALVYWCIATPLIPMWFNNNELVNKIYLSVGIIFSAVGISSSVAKKYNEKIIKDSEQVV